MKPKIIIRADGNTDIGLGHVIRSLALANMLNNDFDCYFATRFLTEYIKTEAGKVCKDIIKLPETEAHYNAFLSVLTGSEIVVLDNYFYGTEYQISIKNKGCKLVCIDDIHDKHFVADRVINHAGGINKNAYSTNAYTCLSFGTGFAILRPEFCTYREKQGNSMLISMGGADKNNNILEVLEVLEREKFANTCYAVIGDAYMHQAKLTEYCRNTNLDVQILKNLSAADMAAVMLKCKYAICPPSTISYEYLSLTGGELYLKVIADNQLDTYNFFVKEKIAFDIADLFVTDKDLLKENLELQRKCFDGKSKDRILNLFKQLNSEKNLLLRDAKISDKDLYFEWVNDADERKNALSPSLINYENHCEWFNNKILNEDAYLWVLEKNGIPIGQIRFDIVGAKSTISSFIDKNYRGQGFGLSIMKLGLEKITGLKKNITYSATIKYSNIASRKIFEQLNFNEYELNNEFIEFVK